MNSRAAARLLVAAAPLAVLAPLLSAGFIGWDDPGFVLDNPLLRSLDAAGLRAMAESTLGGVRVPLAWLSLAIDRALWGAEPGGYHLTSLLLHAASSLLFFECARLLLGDDASAALAALFFSVHPLNVESVAWASERKGVLAGALILGSLLTRLRGRPATALALYAAALAAKPNVLTYPLALLAIETLRLRRRPDWRGLAPYAALSILAFAATMQAMRAAGGASPAPAGAAWAAGQAVHGLLFYPVKALWPSGLSIYYPPLPWFGSWSWPLWAGAAALSAAAWTLRARRDLACAAACYFLLVLPVLGLVRHGVPHAAADRFAYLPGLAFAAVFGAAMGRSPGRRAVAAAWLLALAAASRHRAAQWATPVSLWAAAAESRPSALAEGNLGGLLATEGRFEEAAARLRAAVALDPGSTLWREALGAALARAGRADEARAVWREALSAAPSAEIKALLGASAGGAQGAALLAEACAERPRRADWRADLGAALAALGRRAEAKAAFEAALALEPGLGRAQVGLGLLLQSEGRDADAVARYKAALSDPAARAAAQHNWANVLLARGDAGGAERRYREAVRLDPRLAAAQVNLGNILARRGLLKEAAERYRAALAADPRSREAAANLRAVTP